MAGGNVVHVAYGSNVRVALGSNEVLEHSKAVGMLACNMLQVLVHSMELVQVLVHSKELVQVLVHNKVLVLVYSKLMVLLDERERDEHEHACSVLHKQVLERKQVLEHSTLVHNHLTCCFHRTIERQRIQLQRTSC